MMSLHGARRVWTTACVLTALVFGSAASAESQGSGAVTGRVTLEATGEPVHGATIVLLGARRSAVTRDDGAFEIANVPVGTYEIIARREHLAAARRVVTVAEGQVVHVELAMAMETLHEEIVVTGAAGGVSTAFDAFNAVVSLDTVEIARNMGATVADVLEHQPGVSRRAFGAGSSRPIIRGFDGDRVLIMQDGIRTGDLSSQSGDHGVTIDPAGLERLEVVKGPATLLYGSNAIGGVVNAVTPQDAFRSSPFSGTLGALTVDGGTANAQAGAHASVQWGNGRWTVWGAGGGRRTGDYRTPLGDVGNSAMRLMTGRFGAGWLGARTFFTAAAQLEDSRYGVPFAGTFHEDAAGTGSTDIDIRADRRDVRIDAGLRHLEGRFLDGAKLTVGYTAYGHEEVESAGSVETIGTVFDNDTATVRLELEQRPRKSLSGRLGMEFVRREFTAVGEEALAPPVTQTSLAAFAYEEVPLGRVRLQFGGRIERNEFDAGDRPAGAGHGHDDHEHEAPAPRNRVFAGASGSLGARVGVGAHGALVGNITLATRAPALEELYNFGPHVGNLTFEIGNPDLDLERTLGFDLSLRNRAPRASGELNVFHYRIRNFVFLDVTGELVDGLREASFMQGDSRFSGIEASGHLDVHEHLHLNGSASYVRATLIETGEPLPRIPPFSARIHLEIPWGALTFGPELVITARQDRVFRDERPTPGSTVLNFDASWQRASEHATQTIAVKAYNLTDEVSRLHTSFIKELAPEMGRGVRVTYSVRFF
ncbi:MAG TPA: TonB-dependent receptor [Vicinamibacterales bacterium]|nr:TonB-dependent receptor [Vicinamibacterales bacterium]